MSAARPDQLISDPANYAAMLEPHKTPDDAQAAYDAFWAEVYEARKRHRIAEVLIVSEVHYVHVDGRTIAVDITGAMGGESAPLRLAATAYGKLRRRHDQTIDKLASVQATSRPRKKKEAQP